MYNIKPAIDKEVRCRKCGGIFNHLMSYVSTSSYGLWYWVVGNEVKEIIECPCCHERISSIRVNNIDMAMGNDTKLKDWQKQPRK